MRLVLCYTPNSVIPQKAHCSFYLCQVPSDIDIKNEFANWFIHDLENVFCCTKRLDGVCWVDAFNTHLPFTYESNTTTINKQQYFSRLNFRIGHLETIRMNVTKMLLRVFSFRVAVCMWHNRVPHQYSHRVVWVGLSMSLHRVFLLTQQQRHQANLTKESHTRRTHAHARIHLDCP